MGHYFFFKINNFKKLNKLAHVFAALISFSRFNSFLDRRFGSFLGFDFLNLQFPYQEQKAADAS